MKKLLIIVASATVLVSGRPIIAATPHGILGSGHDFSQLSWNTSRKGLCSPCHTAHHTDPDQLVPLWAHANSTTTTFTVYNSPSMDATDAGSQPGGASKACMSCHDGTVAINTNFAGTTTGTPQFATKLIGPDLHITHPISITYDDALAVKDGGLFKPSTTLRWDATNAGNLAGKTIAQAMLTNDKVECSSCHDPHKQAGLSGSSGIMTKIGGSSTDFDGFTRGSTLCRTCHNKENL